MIPFKQFLVENEQSIHEKLLRKLLQKFSNISNSPRSENAFKSAMLLFNKNYPLTDSEKDSSIALGVLRNLKINSIFESTYYQDEALNILNKLASAKDNYTKQKSILSLIKKYEDKDLGYILAHLTTEL